MTIVANNQNLININYVPPDGGWGWVVVFSSLIIHFIMDGITYSLGTYLTNFIQQFRVTRSEASIVHALLPAITLSCGPIASIFTNRFGCRETTIYGAIIASFGFFVSFFVKSFFFLYISIGLIVGVGFGLIYVPAIVSVGYYFEKKRSLAIGIAVCGSGFGTFVLSPINRILVNNYGINGAFLIKSAIILNLIVCGILIRPVPIEPSEVNKRNKILKSNQRKTTKIKKEKMLESKITESLPTVFSKKVEIAENEKTFLAPCGDAIECTKSFPILNENSRNFSLEQNSSQANSKTQVRQSNKSTLDLMAHIRSLQSITALTSKSLSGLNLNRVIDIEEGNSNKNKIKKFIDFSLLKDPVFIFFSISNFLTSLGFNAPFIYIVDQANSKGIPTNHADYLLATIGISNTIGRIILGILSDMKRVNRLYLYSTVLTICGIATCIEPLFTTYTGLLTYSIVFGFTSGGYVSLTSVLLVDLLGLDKLTNAFGMLLVFQGIATLIGPPSIGILYDIFNSYSIPFFIIGILIGISGLMCFFIPFIKAFKQKN